MPRNRQSLFRSALAMTPKRRHRPTSTCRINSVMSRQRGRERKSERERERGESTICRRVLDNQASISAKRENVKAEKSRVMSKFRTIFTSLLKAKSLFIFVFHFQFSSLLKSKHTLHYTDYATL